jgi:hypothetical protein
VVDYGSHVKTYLYDLSGLKTGGLSDDVV